MNATFCSCFLLVSPPKFLENFPNSGRSLVSRQVDFKPNTTACVGSSLCSNFHDGETFKPLLRIEVWKNEVDRYTAVRFGPLPKWICKECGGIIRKKLMLF